jgi:uncharacterized protein (TIGR02266 family)
MQAWALRPARLHEPFQDSKRGLFALPTPLAAGSARRAPGRCQFGKSFAAFDRRRGFGIASTRNMVEAAEHVREFPRFEVNAYVDYTGNEVLLFHRIQNISLGGVCIQTSGVEEVGTMVDLVLNFPDLDASIALTGEVVWANREPPMDMGIRYVDLDEDRKDTLRKYINMVRK